MAHGSRAPQILQHDCLEGLETVSALSPRQRWGQCPVSETIENLKGGEAEKKLQKAQEGTGQGTLSTRTLLGSGAHGEAAAISSRPGVAFRCSDTCGSL